MHFRAIFFIGTFLERIKSSLKEKVSIFHHALQQTQKYDIAIMAIKANRMKIIDYVLYCCVFVSCLVTFLFNRIGLGDNVSFSTIRAYKGFRSIPIKSIRTFRSNGELKIHRNNLAISTKNKHLKKMKSNNSGPQDNGETLNLEDYRRLGFLDKDDNHPDLLSEYNSLWSCIESAGLSFSTNKQNLKRQNSIDLRRKVPKKIKPGSQPDLLFEYERIWTLVEDAGLTFTPCVKKQKSNNSCKPKFPIRLKFCLIWKIT